jgi:hypothetical protein
MIKLKHIKNACSDGIYHIYEGEKFLATVLRWSKDKWVLVDEDNNPCGLYKSPQAARNRVKADRALRRRPRATFAPLA